MITKNTTQQSHVTKVVLHGRKESLLYFGRQVFVPKEFYREFPSLLEIFMFKSMKAKGWTTSLTKFISPNNFFRFPLTVMMIQETHKKQRDT